MIYQKLGLYDIDKEVYEEFLNTPDSAELIITLTTPAEIIDFLGSDVIRRDETPWKILISNWRSVVKASNLLKKLREAHLKNASIYFIFLFTDEAELSNLQSELNELKNVHFIKYASTTPHLLKDCIKNIEHHAKMSWLTTKTQDISRSFDEFIVEDISEDIFFNSFLEKIKKTLDASSISVYVIQESGDILETAHHTSTAERGKIMIQDCLSGGFQFQEVGETHSSQPDILKLLSNFQESESNSVFYLLTTSVLQSEPVIVLYNFDSKFNVNYDLPFLRLLCNIASREIINFLYRSEIEKAKSVTQKLSSYVRVNYDNGLTVYDGEKAIDELFTILKNEFNAQEVSFIKLEDDSDEKDYFEKISSEWANHNKEIFDCSQPGFANYSLFNDKALLINYIDVSTEPPVGHGYAYDILNLNTSHGTAVALPTFRTKKTFEDEKSLIYYPIKHVNLQMLIKIGSYIEDNAFTLPQLRMLEIISPFIVSILVDLKNLQLMSERIETKEIHEKITKKAEQLFFFREITISILHQLKNYFHTLNSDMLVIEASSSRLEDKYEGQVKKNLFESIVNAQSRINKASLLLVRAFERGHKLTPILRLCDLVEDILRKEVLPYMEARAEGRITIKKSFTNKKYYVRVDDELLRESLFNIVDNSVYAIKESKTSKKLLFLGVREVPDHSVQIIFHDSGAGVPGQLISQIFDPFVTTKKDGTGLGLFFARKLIEDHFYGSIKISKTTPNKGTTLVITLPLQEK